LLALVGDRAGPSVQQRTRYARDEQGHGVRTEARAIVVELDHTTPISNRQQKICYLCSQFGLALRILTSETGCNTLIWLFCARCPTRVCPAADAYRERRGEWPKSSSGPTPEAPGETWLRVHHALKDGLRGLPGGSSLPRLLQNERGVRNLQDLDPFTVDQILAWADAHHARTSLGPTCKSGQIWEAPGENWQNVQNALHRAFAGSRADRLSRVSSPKNEGGTIPPPFTIPTADDAPPDLRPDVPPPSGARACPSENSVSGNSPTSLPFPR
jgi:hypothetical protein